MESKEPQQKFLKQYTKTSIKRMKTSDTYDSKRRLAIFELPNDSIAVRHIK